MTHANLPLTLMPTPVTDPQTQTHKIKSPHHQALPPFRWQHSKGKVDFMSNGVWVLKFPIDEPWRGGAQTVK